MKPYKHLFFDLDHTLWDFNANSKATLQYLYREFELDKKGIEDFESFSDRYEQHNEMLWAQLRSGAITREELRWRRMELTLSDYKIDNRPLVNELSVLYLEKLPRQGLLLDGAKALLDYCMLKGYVLHIITNGFETTQQEKLRTAALDAYFSNVFTSENAGSMKPHRPIFEYALRTTGAVPEESIMIGDCLEADIRGARNIGMDQIFYNPLQLQHEDPVTYEVRHLNEIKDIL